MMRRGSSSRWSGVSQRLLVMSMPPQKARRSSITTILWWCAAPGVEAASSRVWMRGWAIQRIRVKRVVPRNRVRSAPMFQRSRKTSSSGFLLDQPEDEVAQGARLARQAGRLVGELDAGVEIPADQHDAMARLQHAEPRRGEIVGGIDHQRSPRRRRLAPRRGVDRRMFGRLHPAASHAHRASTVTGKAGSGLRVRFSSREMVGAIAYEFPSPVIREGVGAQRPKAPWWRGNPRRRGKAPGRICVSDHDLKSERAVASPSPSVTV